MPQWRDLRRRGPRAAGESRTPKGAFAGRVPDPFWRQRRSHPSPVSMEKIAESPGCFTSLSDTTYGGAGRVGLLWSPWDSPPLFRTEVLFNVPATFRRGRRRRPESHRDLRINSAGQGLSCYACVGPARSRTGIGASSLPRSPAELRVRGRGRIRTCDRLSPPPLKGGAAGPLATPPGGGPGGFERRRAWEKAASRPGLADRPPLRGPR